MSKKKQDRVIIFDTTLRDGEQSPGASLNQREKLEIAHQLAALKVDVIEAGFPIASPDDFSAVQAIAKEVKGPRICGLARCVTADIERAAEAVSPAKKSRIHVFLATSAIHRQYKLKKARSEIIKQAVAGVAHARSFCKDVEFSPEDASRTEPDFLAEVVEAVIDAGATTINIPDTVGFAVPSEFGPLIAGLFDEVPNIGKAIISVHCHNDLGLAVANSLIAVQNGARAIECTINGLGERAGNCALEEVVMAMRTRNDVFDLSTNIDVSRLRKVSQMVSSLTGMSVQRNKAIVGANAFAHEAGIHQDGLLKNRSTYEIMNPADVGADDGTELVLGKHSGRHAFRHHMDRLGVKLTTEELQKAYDRFIQLADKKKSIYDDDLLAIARDEMSGAPTIYALEYLGISTGSDTVPTATLRISRGDETKQDASTGDGPVDAALKAIDRMTGVSGRLLDFRLQSVTMGKDALGEVSIRVDFSGTILSAKAASTDIVEAAAKAYLSCVNRYLSTQAKAPAGKTRPKKKAVSKKKPTAKKKTAARKSLKRK